MKKGLLLLGMALVMCTVTSYGQMSKQEIEEIAAEQSLVLEKEGWKVSVGTLPLKYQLRKVYTMQDEGHNGQSKYIISEGKVKGTTYEAAKVHAMEIAKRNMISLIDNMSITQTAGETVNTEGADVPESGDLSETKYNSYSTLELGNLTTVLLCYKHFERRKLLLGSKAEELGSVLAHSHICVKRCVAVFTLWKFIIG